MMRNIWRLLPFFFVEWFARRHCERYEIHGRIWAGPFPGALIRLTPKQEEKWKSKQEIES